MKKTRIFALVALLLTFCLTCFAFAACGGDAGGNGGGSSGGDGGGNSGGDGGGQQTAQYTVTFNLNYTGATGAPAAQTVNSGGKATKPTDPTRQGYTFGGWFVNTAGTGTAFDFNTAITANTTLYAKWTESGGGQGGGGQGGGGTTPQTGPPAGVIPEGTPFLPTGQGSIRTTSNLKDVHQGTTERDASWNRYNVHTRADVGSTELAPNVTCTIAGSSPSEGGDGDGFNAIGGFRSSTGAVLSYYINSSAAAQVGLYVEVSGRTAGNEMIFNNYFTPAVNNAEVTTANVPLALIGEGGTNNAAANLYIFLGYVNLTAGNNVVTFTRTATAVSSGCYNFYGIRISAQSAVITAGTPPAA